MFDETVRAIKRLNGTTFRVNLPVDEKGCIDRCCPSPQCGNHFKVVLNDWRDKVPNERAFCPYCRFESSPRNWNTSAQSSYIRSVGRARV